MLVDRVVNRPWLTTQDTLELIVSVATRQQLDPELARRIQEERAARPSALALRAAQPLEGSKTAGVRGGVAIVPIVGPLIRHADVFTRVSGLTSVETIAQDVQLAVDSPAVHTILLSIDSPGGEVTGIASLAEAIRAARKPVVAYVEGLGASGAYWLASGARRIIVESTAGLGSIGVVLAVRDPQRQPSAAIEFVSSQSPHKRPNPHTDAGKAQYQRVVDQTAEAFVEAVARNRGVSTKTVLERYGAGGLLVGRHAVDAGLADGVGTFEAVLVGMATGTLPGPAARPVAAQGGAWVETEEEVRSRTAAWAARHNRNTPAMSPERRRELLSATPEGRAVLTTEAEEETRAHARAWAEKQNRQQRRQS